jgi:hypothetical protein
MQGAKLQEAMRPPLRAGSGEKIEAGKPGPTLLCSSEEAIDIIA